MSDLRAQLLENGFCIIRNAVPPAEAGAPARRLRGPRRPPAGDLAPQRGPEDPPGGVWETAAQPRLSGYDGLVDDAGSAAAVELLLGRPLEASREIMGAEAPPTQFMLMCNPVRDHGPAAWHRDIHPIDQAPVTGLQRDLLANGPGYLDGVVYTNLILHWGSDYSARLRRTVHFGHRPRGARNTCPGTSPGR